METPDRLTRVVYGIKDGTIPFSYETVNRWYEDQVFPGLIQLKYGPKGAEFYWNVSEWYRIVERNIGTEMEEYDDC